MKREIPRNSWQSTLEFLPRRFPSGNGVEEHAITYDALTEGVHTSLLVNRCKYNAKDSSKNHTENNAMLCLQEMQNGSFDFVREKAKFVGIEFGLKQSAKG